MVVNMEDHTLLGSSGETVFVTDLSVATTLNLRVYWPNKIEPSSEMVTDTLYWQSFGYTPDDAHSSLPLTAEFIQEAMRQISARVRELFIPHVDNVNRYIYTSTNPAMDDAYDFWQQKKYKEASYLWEYSWMKEWLDTYNTDPERAEKALEELEKAFDMPYMGKDRCDDATRNYLRENIDKAKLGDPSGFRECIDVNY